MKQYRIDKDRFYIGASDFIDDWNIYYNLMSKPAIELLQYETPMFHFFNYVSRKIKNVSSEDEFARQFIHSFKNGNIEDVSARKTPCTTFAASLESLGANVVQGVFLAEASS